MKLEHLFSIWEDVTPRLAAAEHILLLSDYDGTLCPIVRSPELAKLPEKTRELLRVLAHEARFTVGVISGRSLEDLEEKVGIEDIIYAGCHGLEMEGPGLSFAIPHAREIRATLQALYQTLAKSLISIDGALVENKGLTLSVHYRLVKENEIPKVKSTFEREINSLLSQKKIIIIFGKKVYEVRPALSWDKGKAIDLLLSRNKTRTLPIFLGDDLTDEDGFKAVKKYSGISIFVGKENEETCARYFLKSPGEVGKFLEMLVHLTSSA